MRRWLGLLLLLGLPAVASAQDPKDLPALSPDFMVVTEFDAAKGQLQLTITQYREQEMQKLTVGGAGGVVLEVQKVIGPFQAQHYLTLKDCKVMEASGKAIAPAEFAQRFKVGTVVIVTTDGNPPAKAFTQLLAPNTIIVVRPPVKPDPNIKLPPLPPKAPDK
jgi:hypothetical protein